MIEACPHTVVRAPSSPAPRVSVIVPTYNAREHLREAVESLLAQSFADLEVLVIDDASTDGSIEAVADVADPRLGVVRLLRNAGPSGARNTGISLARGEYIALLDADDVSVPRRIEKQVAVLDRRPEVGLVGCLVHRVDLQGRVIARGTDVWRLPDAALRPLMLFANPFPAAYLLRRSALPEGGFRHMMYAEDYALAADVAAQHEVALVREALVHYRVSPGGIMGTKLDQVARDALVTHRRLCAEVGLDPARYDEPLMRSMMYFSRQPDGVLGVQYLGRLQAWLDELQLANARTRRYPADALQRAAARLWEFLLLHATKQERLPLNGGYLLQLWGYALPHGRLSLRLRSLGHAALNLVRGPRVPAGVAQGDRR